VSRAAAKLGLVLVSLGLSLALAEAAVRVAAPQAPSWLALYRRHPALPFFALQPDLHAEVATGETHWSVATDANGFRVGDAAPPEPKCSVLWLGDSFAFGHGVDYHESIAGQVLAAVPQARLVNAAVPGYGPVQYRQTLEYLLDAGESFDYVYVLTYVGNDFHDCVWDKDVAVSDGVVGDRGDLKSYVKRHSHLYRLTSSVYHRLAPLDESAYAQVDRELADPREWERESLSRAAGTYERELARVQELARARGGEARFVILPTQAAVRAGAATSTSETDSQPRLPVARARAALERHHAPVFDATDVLAAHVADEPMYFPYDGHLTPAGNRLVARALLDTWPLECPRGRPSP
jgi:hypothetical protein